MAGSSDLVVEEPTDRFLVKMVNTPLPTTSGWDHLGQARSPSALILRSLRGLGFDCMEDGSGVGARAAGFPVCRGD